MESRNIIVIATTIAFIFENANVNQLKTFGGYTGNETISEAFLHAFDNIAIPKDRQQTSNAVGYLYDYLDHLLAAANLIHKYKPLVNPVFWCLITLPKEMRNAGFKDTAEETISEFLYFRTSQKGYYDYIKYSMANTIDAVCPKDFCDKFDSSTSQISVQQNVELLSNADEHTSINYTQPPTSTFYRDNEESLNIRINKLHLDDFKED